MKKLLITLSAFSVLFWGVGNAKAEIIRIDWDMLVTNADSSNGYGLNPGDTLSGFAYYDSLVLPSSGNVVLSFGAGTGHSMQFDIPPVTFYETNDRSYLSGRNPYIRFLDGSPIGISYRADVKMNTPFIGANYRLEIFDTSLTWGVLDAYGLRVIGTYDNFTQTPVPEPGTMLLLGSGLAGLVGYSRRRMRK